MYEKKYETIQKVQKLKEIQALKLLGSHQHIIKFIQVLYDEPTGKVALVFELMEQNLYQCLVRNNLHPLKIKAYMYQLLTSVDYIHKNGIFHRNIKPQNVLIVGDRIKLSDFHTSKGIYSEQPYTDYISTRWYRAPECLMTDGYYDEKIDIWGCGCVLFEMITKYPLFNGKGELDQIHRINKVLGTPKQALIDLFKSRATHMSSNQFNFPHQNGIGIQKLLPNQSKQLIDLLYRLLAYDPSERISAQDALKHQYFADIVNQNLQNIKSTILELPQSTFSNIVAEHDDTSQRSMEIQQMKQQQINIIQIQAKIQQSNMRVQIEKKEKLLSLQMQAEMNIFSAENDKNSIQPLIDLQNLKRQPHMEIQNKSQLLNVKQTSINEINSKKDIYE